MIALFILTYLLTQTKFYSFAVNFPESDIQTNLSKAVLEYLQRTHNSKSKEGITWEYALEKLPRGLLAKYGFTEVTLHNHCMPDSVLEIESESFLIPPREVRLIQTSSNMTAYLADHLDTEILHQNPAGLQEKIAEFAVIWVPRFVDMNLFELDKFIESALAQTPWDFWEVQEEREEVDPEEYDSRDHYSACL